MSRQGVKKYEGISVFLESSQLSLIHIYPDGEFKYYFIDIGRTVKNKRFLGASYSALHQLLEALEEKIRSEAQRKVFIYFSNLQDDRVEDIYKRLNECLHRWKNRLEERIVVISEDVSRR